MIDLSSIWPPSPDDLGNIQAHPTLVAYLRGEYTPTPEEQAALAALEIQEEWANLRSFRNHLLSASDWRSTLDYPYDNQHEWSAYRRALRDLPQNTIDPSSVEWPTPPAWGGE